MDILIKERYERNILGGINNCFLDQVILESIRKGNTWMSSA